MKCSSFISDRFSSRFFISLLLRNLLKVMFWSLSLRTICVPSLNVTSRKRPSPRCQSDVRIMMEIILIDFIPLMENELSELGVVTDRNVVYWWWNN